MPTDLGPANPVDPDEEWSRIAQELRHCREREREEWGDVDDLMIAKYLLGTADSEQRRKVEAARGKSPKVRRCLDMLEPFRPATPQPVPKPAAAPLAPHRRSPWSKVFNPWRPGAAEVRAPAASPPSWAAVPTPAAGTGRSPAPSAAAGAPVRPTGPLFAASPRRRWPSLPYVLGAALAASVLFVAFAFYGTRPEDGNRPEPERGCTPANLEAAARLPTSRQFCDRLAELLADGRQARLQHGATLRESVEGTYHDCQAVVALLDSHKTALSAAERRLLEEQCKTWNEAFALLMDDIDSHKGGESALRDRAEQQFAGLVALLQKMSQQAAG